MVITPEQAAGLDIALGTAGVIIGLVFLFILLPTMIRAVAKAGSASSGIVRFLLLLLFLALCVVFAVMGFFWIGFMILGLFWLAVAARDWVHGK
jgi:ABC-type transport system involved in cytochrome c biogenesis permease component